MKTPVFRVCVVAMMVGAFGLAARAEGPKVTHDWPGYTGPDGSFADQSRVPLLDDLSRAVLLWTSEHDGFDATQSLPRTIRVTDLGR